MSLHNDIMNIQVPAEIKDQKAGDRIVYKNGHRDARHEAAELALTYENLVQEAYDALKQVNKIVSEAATEGFNCHAGDWAERLFYSQQATSNFLRKIEKGEYK